MPTPLVRSGPLGGACSCAMAVFLRCAVGRKTSPHQKNRGIAAEKVPAPRRKISIHGDRGAQSHNVLYRFNCPLSHSTMVVVICSDGSPGVRPMCAPCG